MTGTLTDQQSGVAFGAFITPGSADSQQAVRLVVHAERVGLDLVAFQDHPYLPQFLDTWTLLSYVAARTRRIRLAPCVLNLPLRPPATTARAAASLDRLSGGRLELGLGAGAADFTDDMYAMGAARRGPARAVTAVAEAVTIIRELWDTNQDTAARVDGSVYRLTGAHRGPAPAHKIGIWLGAYQERMLRLTGQVADGWLPSSSYLPPDRLPAANRRIDEAAEAAGRPPSAVQRLYNISGTFKRRPDGFLNGPVEQWIDELSTLVLTQQTNSFILGSDDPDTLSRFAGEVAPAVRETVAALCNETDSRR